MSSGFRVPAHLQGSPELEAKLRQVAEAVRALALTE
jgi:hypothetical protein